jgi:integrase
MARGLGRAQVTERVVIATEFDPFFSLRTLSFGGGLRWGETTALIRPDIDWSRGRLHVQRAWSESGGRVERCKDGEDRWVTLSASTVAALRAHCGAMELEAALTEWTPDQRQLVLPNTAGGITARAPRRYERLTRRN